MAGVLMLDAGMISLIFLPESIEFFVTTCGALGVPNCPNLDQVILIHAISSLSWILLEFKELMSHYPGKILSLILPDAAMDASELNVSKELSDWIENTWRAGKESGIDKAKVFWITGSLLAPAIRNSRASGKVKKMIDDYSGWHWVNDDPGFEPESYPLEKLVEIKAPNLVIVGELNPRDYHHMADLQKQYIPHSTKIVLPHAGYALNIENPIQFNEQGDQEYTSFLCLIR